MPARIFINVDLPARKEILQIRSCYLISPTSHYCLKKRKKNKLIIGDIWNYISAECNYIEGLRALNIIRYAALSLYDVPDVRQVFPKISLKTEDVQKIYDIRLPYIILNPYSNSMKIETDVFLKIIENIKARGFHLYTNVVSSQIPLDGTKELKCSPDEFFALSAGAAAIISIRSGILDYIVSNTQKMFVLYDNRKYYELYSLKAWETDAEIYEYKYKNDEVILDSIVKSIVQNLTESDEK